MLPEKITFFNNLSKEEIIKEILKDDFQINYIPEKWNSDKDVVLALAKVKDHIMGRVDKKFYEDKDVMLEVVKRTPLYFVRCSEKIRSDKDIVKEVILKSPVLFKQASIQLKEDRDFLLEIAAMPGAYGAISHASEGIKDDYEFMSEAIKKNVDLFELASPRLKKDKNLTIEAIKKESFSFFIASEDLWNDLDILRLLKGWEPDLSVMYYDIFLERMEFLDQMEQVLEDEAWMRNNANISTELVSQKIKKF